MTCRFQKVPVVFNKSLVDLENCTSFLKTTCDLLNSTCEIDLLKLLARHTCALQKPPSCNDNGYKFEFKIYRPNRYVSKILAKKSEMLKL